MLWIIGAGLSKLYNGLEVTWYAQLLVYTYMYIYIYVHGVLCTVDAGKGKYRLVCTMGGLGLISQSS